MHASLTYSPHCFFPTIPLCPLHTVRPRPPVVHIAIPVPRPRHPRSFIFLSIPHRPVAFLPHVLSCPLFVYAQLFRLKAWIRASFLFVLRLSLVASLCRTLLPLLGIHCTHDHDACSYYICIRRVLDGDRLQTSPSTSLLHMCDSNRRRIDISYLGHLTDGSAVSGWDRCGAICGT